MEKRLLEAFPEVETVVSRTGRAEISEDPMGPEQTDLFIMLRPRKEWGTGRSKAELVEAVRENLSAIPGIRMSFSQPIALRVNELVSGVRSDLAVKVYGHDLDLLKEYADRVAGTLSGLPGARDVTVEQVSGMDRIDVTYDRAAMARHGIAAADISDVIETALAGREATRVIEGPMRVAAVVRFPGAERMDPSELGGLLVPGKGGARVPLGRLATIATVEGPARVGREKGMRRVAVEANVSGRDLGGFAAAAAARLGPLEKELPSGYFLEYGGQFENQRRAMRRLAVVVPAALLLILLFLYLALGSPRDALLVVLVLPTLYDWLESRGEARPRGEEEEEVRA
jgi:heavy metal efflux system protein